MSRCGWAKLQPTYLQHQNVHLHQKVHGGMTKRIQQPQWSLRTVHYGVRLDGRIPDASTLEAPAAALGPARE